MAKKTQKQENQNHTFSGKDLTKVDLNALIEAKYKENEKLYLKDIPRWVASHITPGSVQRFNVAPYCRSTRNEAVDELIKDYGYKAELDITGNSLIVSYASPK